MSENHFTPHQLDPNPERFFDGLDMERVAFLHLAASGIEDITYRGLNNTDIFWLTDRVLVRNGWSSESKVYDTYRKRHNELAAEFEKELFEDAPAGMLAEDSKLAPLEAVIALQLDLSALSDKAPGALGRLASSAGYLFERGALEGKVIFSSELQPDVLPKEARGDAHAESLLQNTDFALGLLRAAVILDQAGLPEAETDVYKAWRNYCAWQTARIWDNPETASGAYIDIDAIGTNLSADGHDIATLQWLAVPALEKIAESYSVRRSQPVRVAAMLALHDLLERSPENQDYQKRREYIQKKNKGMSSWFARDLLLKHSGNTVKGNEIEASLVHELTGVQVFDTHFLLRAMLSHTQLLDHYKQLTNIK